ncbi:MAG: iron ABC transporter permease [Halieaceae bacterium]|nr:iron ABC transporter permease [Halieaceae bacterium]MCP5167588.1 iron ABC transporter permease [Pseudomonadales bacterium]MCP5186149.1 iron ABC transporter permease [Pseudomonadales bacterium]
MRAPTVPSALVLGGLLLLGALVSLTRGAMTIPAGDSLLALADVLLGSSTAELATHQRAVILELRLPRTLLAIFIGAILAQCGAAMQGMFRNPLADPGIIGVSAGAAVGAVLAIYLAPADEAWWSVPLGAFSAGLATSLLIYKLARGSSGTSVFILLLAGIAISALAGAFIGFITYLSDDTRLRDLSLWQMGSLASADGPRVWIAMLAFALLALRLQRHAAALNALLLGEAEARHLGIDVESLKRELVILVALGVGLAVSAAGVIGFVGLVVPHFVRMLAGPCHHGLLPLSALCGGLLLLIADVAARLLLAPAELPVGILTALLGAPFFILLLFQQKQRSA